MEQPIPILMYHLVAELDRRSLYPLQYMPPKQFGLQMRVLRAMGFRSVAMGDLFNKKTSGRTIVLTFDDAYENFYENALPYLKSTGHTATVFAVANQIGGTNAWDISSGECPHPLMSAMQLRECVDGGIEIGSHTLDHVKLAQVPTESAWKQISDSKSVIESVIGTEVRSFSYPHGSHTREVRDLVERAGYAAACTTVSGLNKASDDRFLLRRINCRTLTHLPLFLRRVLAKTAETRTQATRPSG